MSRPAALALLTAVVATDAVAETARWRLDPQLSQVHFEILHFGTSTIRGRFAVGDGEVELDAAAASGTLGVRLPTASIDTGLRFFDARLRQADLLASTAHPEAFLVARVQRFDGATPAQWRGELTLRGVGMPFTLTARSFGCSAAAPSRAERCGGEFEGRLRRSAFGIDFGLPFVADEVRMVVNVVADRLP